MADNRKPPVHRRPRFLLCCVYIMGYVILRMYGDIVNQTTQIRVETQSHVASVVAPDPSIPHWRQQVYRGFFSPCMVVEEEAKIIANGGSGGIVQGIGDFFRDILQI